MKKTVAVALAWTLGTAGAWAQATPCLVLGEPTAQVRTAEGVRAPVFMAPACGELRLVQGKASASWVARDGRPRVLPITESGVTQLPAPGSEERSVKVVWSELTSSRERQQPAYMRSFGGERAPKVYVGAGGLELMAAADSDALLRIARIDGDAVTPVGERRIASGSPILLRSDDLTADAIHLLQVQRGDIKQEWRWRTLTRTEAANVDAQMAAIDVAVEAADQRLMLQAMLFEQLNMRVNMDLVVQALRSRRDR